MGGYIQLFLVCCVNYVKSLSVLDSVFRRNTQTEIINTFKVLKIFSLQKAAEDRLYQTDQEMFSNFAKRLDKGISFTKSMGNKCMYLGWTPLAPLVKHSEEYDETEIIRRNDCKGTDFKLIPLYYVFIVNDGSHISVDRIYQNPAIELNIDIQLLKKHIDELSEISGVKVVFDNLRYFEDGRYHFEFGDTRPGPKPDSYKNMKND
jgi:hypothetical protein